MTRIYSVHADHDLSLPMIEAFDVSIYSGATRLGIWPQAKSGSAAYNLRELTVLSSNMEKYSNINLSYKCICNIV